MQNIRVTRQTPNGNLTTLIPLADIIAFKADAKYITVVHDSGESIITDTLKRLESELPQFVRVNRNALVSRSRITGLEGRVGRMDVIAGGTRFAVSRRETSAVRRLVLGMGQ